ncbi:MAG: Fe-S cluster assembly protein SufB [Candidatus Gottesmanbacteria bacterium]
MQHLLKKSRQKVMVTHKQSFMPAPYAFGFHKPDNYVYKSGQGLDKDVIRAMSTQKDEPMWMLEFRLKSFGIYSKKKMPIWGPSLSDIQFENLYYYLRPVKSQAERWEELPDAIRDTYEKIGIPEMEKKFLSGVSAQWESEVVYKSIEKTLHEKGVIFTDMDTAVKKYPELVKQYMGTLVPAGDNKFAALNGSVWSGGSFIYVPKNVSVGLPLQAYFRINAANMGQFERTLIIADEGSFVHYIEGCFLKGTKVKTRYSEKCIEDIQPGDYVYTHKGRYQRVRRVMTRPCVDKIYTIKYYGNSGATLRVTKEHPLLVCKRQRKEYTNRAFSPQWIRAGELSKDDYLMYPIIKQKQDNPYVYTDGVFSYQVKNNILSANIPFGNGIHMSNRSVKFFLKPDFFRLAGYFLAEGHIDKEHYIMFTFNEKETEYILDTKKIIRNYFKKDVIVGKNRNHGVTLTLCSTIAARLFTHMFGMTNRSKHIPEWMIAAEKRFIKQLIKGMWLGDGSYDKKGNMFRYSSVTKQLIQSFYDILLRLGIVASINLQKREHPKQPMYSIILSRVCNTKFSNIVGMRARNGRHEGSPFYLNSNYLFLSVKSITSKKMKTKVYNFSVEKDESYVAEGVVSHNCTAPIYSTDSLHSAVVEIFVKKGARVRYSTVQNWSTNVYNLVTKRARVEEEGIMEWVDGNIGSKITMKYPAVYLVGRKAHGEVLSIAYAGKRQIQDTGGKMMHLAPETTSQIISKSISSDGGRTSYRGLVHIARGAKGSRSKVVCDALIVDDKSRSDTYPKMDVHETNSVMEHEASVSRISDEQLFYVTSRGVSVNQAASMIVNGFIEPIVKELPLEYAVELNRLMDLEMQGSMG